MIKTEAQSGVYFGRYGLLVRDWGKGRKRLVKDGEKMDEQRGMDGGIRATPVRTILRV